MNEEFLQLLLQQQQNGINPIPSNYGIPTTNGLIPQYPQAPSSAYSDSMGGYQFRPEMNLNPTQDPSLAGFTPSNAFADPTYNMMQSEAMTGGVGEQMSPQTTGNFINSNPQQSQPWQNSLNYLPISPIDNSVFKLGQSLQFNTNNPYATDKQKGWNTVRGIASGAKTLTSLLRSGFAGAAYQARSNEASTDYLNRQGQQNFAPLSQYQDGGQAFNPSMSTDPLFQQWYQANTIEGQNGTPYSENMDYDYLSFFMNGQNLNPNYNVDNHFPDTFKRPNHETFSNESIYSTSENPGGSWNGDRFIPQQRIFENGGQLTQEALLTGSYIGNQAQPNAEIEGGEYVQNPDFSVQKAVGQSHEQNGIPVNLEPGSKVISDNLKLGGKNARELKKQYDIDVKANHTFAQAIDKYKKKIGLQKIDDEQETLFKDLGKNEDVEQGQTASINEAYLAERISQVETQKKPLQYQLSMFTDMVFNKQEELKGNDVQLQFENGGIFTTNNLKELFKKHSIDEKEGMEMIAGIKKYQIGGQTDYNFYNTNPNILSQYNNQPFGASTVLAGNVTNNDVATQRILQQANLLPNTLRRAGLIGDQNAVNVAPETVGQFQNIYNNYANTALSAAQTNPYLTPEQKAQFAKKVEQETFNQEGVRGFDNVYGNFTSSRGGFNLPYLTQEDKKKYPNLQFIGDAVDTTGKLKDTFKDLDPNTIQALQQTVKNSGEDALDIGLLTINQKEQAAMNPETAQQEAQQISVPQSAIPFGGLNLIDQTLPPPSGLQATRLADADYRNYEAVAQGYEPQLQQIYNQQTAAIDQIQGLTPAQQAIVASNISANSQQASNQAIGAVNSFNQQEASRIGNLNTDLYNNASIRDEQYRDQFENRTYQAMANTEQNLNNFFQYNNQLAALNAQQQNQAATLANLFSNVTLNSNGQVVSNGVNPSYYVPNGLPIAQPTRRK